MTPFASPLDVWMLGMRTAVMVAEAQTVIAYRVMGMAGVWPVAAGEDQRMVAEKWPAFLKSSSAATQAMMQGKRPVQVMAEALKPIGRKTRANSKRLSNRRAR
jgi:hypothetical protein